MLNFVFVHVSVTFLLLMLFPKALHIWGRYYKFQLNKPYQGRSTFQDLLQMSGRPDFQRTSQQCSVHCPKSPGCHHSYATGCRSHPAECNLPKNTHQFHIVKKQILSIRTGFEQNIKKYFGF